MKKALLLLLFISFSGFSQTDKETALSNCAILKSAFSDKKIIRYLHPELTQRAQLYLVKNQFCNLNEKLGKISIETVDELIAIDTKNWIKITSLKIEKGGKVLKLYYPMEGAVFVVKFDNNDKIRDVDILEK